MEFDVLLPKALENYDMIAIRSLTINDELARKSG